MLEEQKKQHEARLGELSTVLEEKEKRLQDIVGAEDTLSDLGELRRKLEGEIGEYRRKIDEQVKLLDELAGEYETLIGLKGSAHDIYRELQERKSMIQQLDEEIARKGETLKVLEEEVEAARSLLTLLQDPENIRNDDLEALSQQLLNIVKVRSGELPMLKPLEDSLLQNARKKVVELVWPAIKNEFVPKWVFDKLEKEMKEMINRKTQLEQEVEKLSREVEELRKRTLERVETPQQPVQQQTPKSEEERPREFRLRSNGRVLASIDKKVNVKCSICSSYNLMYLPKAEELEAAKNEKDKLTLTCISCSKTISLDPSALDRFY
jgi:chromosome segregation ATPase